MRRPTAVAAALILAACFAGAEASAQTFCHRAVPGGGFVDLAGRPCNRRRTTVVEETVITPAPQTAAPLVADPYCPPAAVVIARRPAIRSIAAADAPRAVRHPDPPILTRVPYVSVPPLTATARR